MAQKVLAISSKDLKKMLFRHEVFVDNLKRNIPNPGVRLSIRDCKIDPELMNLCKERELEAAGFCNVNIDDCNVAGTNFRGASFDGSYCRRGNFSRCNFSNASFYRTYISSSDFSGCDMRGSFLREVIMNDKTNFSHALLYGAILPEYMYQEIKGNSLTIYDALHDKIICNCWEIDTGSMIKLDSFVTRVELLYGGSTARDKVLKYQEYASIIQHFKNMRELRKENVI